MFYNSYTFSSTLTITRILDTDFNRIYRCVSKNLLGIARIRFYTSPPGSIGGDGDDSLEEGAIRPPKESYEELCPAPEPCEECLPAK